ncbi:MAG: Ni-sirohydrochlorin a,c-diamide synthase [Methanothrix sp.]|jgi:cobyrinic acid a,c-diamide synthase|nr:Ni-sirohydrochlorin a,c-diamide synthase [Methanothrix sp.]
MKADCPRILIAGDRSSSGKTTIVAGLLSALCRRGLEVQPFKVAMDYIDPSYHTWITGRSCRNLDGYLMTEAAIKEIYAHAAESTDIAVIEGVRGLYEGYDGDLGSTAQIAKLLRTPVIFVVDARSITRSCAAIVKGYMDFDPQVEFKGVILNKVGSERHAQKAIKEIERYAGVEVVGVIRRNEEMHLAMRHLGLVPVLEGKTRHEGFQERVDKIRQIVEESLNLDRIQEIAKEAPPLPEVEADLYRQNALGQDLCIGVARDEAFNFYYRDNLELMELAGAKVVPFSPVHDTALPQVDGIYIGGGYPELYAQELSENAGMRRALEKAHEKDLPIFAECGGLMYLAREIEWDGACHEMIGLVPGKARRGSTRIVSYVHGTIERDCSLGKTGEAIMGHEFHHSEMLMDKSAKYAIRLERGTGIKDGWDGMCEGNLVASYTHIHSASFRGFPANFIKACNSKKNI